MDLSALYPPFALSVTAGPLRMRVLTDDDLPDHAALLDRPIFADERADHVFEWALAEPAARRRDALAHIWRLRAEVSPAAWCLSLGVFVDGHLVGMQDLRAEEFAARRTVSSGSWLTLDAQGRGIGTLMRRAMLVLAFDHLGAQRAESASVAGNVASERVSLASGYTADGTQVGTAGGRAQLRNRWLATPASMVRPTEDVQVTGLSAALRSMLGA